MAQAVPVRVFIDTDPVFTQIRHLTDPAARERALQHTAFFSFGENVGQAGVDGPGRRVPLDPTRQPVVLEAWPVTRGRRGGPIHHGHAVGQLPATDVRWPHASG